MPRREPPGTVVTNRRARHDYEILETFEAGIVLRGSEVKTLREGKGSLQDAYAVVEGGDVVLHMQIPTYSHTGYEGHEPTRPRKLLLHRKQIDQLAARINERGLTLVPLRIYFKNQLVKVELGLARGKRAYDKRQSIALLQSFDQLVGATAMRGHEQGLLPRPLRGDFPAYGTVYRDLDEEQLAEAHNIAWERHRALNWLCGLGKRWEDVPTDT